MKDWRVEHKKTIDSFLGYLNKVSEDFILKGGTALLTCYGLDRFSEDIDLDGKNTNIESIVKDFCTSNSFTYRIGKDTDTAKRYFINYGNVSKPLKVEVSFRRKQINNDETEKINGILVYDIDTLCRMKTNAYSSRDKIRDLYDITFICNNYYDRLSSQTVLQMQDALGYKGIEQFDYILKVQRDELIDENKLAADFLLMFDKLGILYDEKEKEIISSIEQSSKEEDTLLMMVEEIVDKEKITSEGVSYTEQEIDTDKEK